MKITVMILLILSSFLSACGNQPVESTQGEVTHFKIVATTTQASDIARILTKGVPEERFTIVGLMGPGIDPHLYKPKESDIYAMNTADMIVSMGLHLEGKFGTVLETLIEQGTSVVTLSEPVLNSGFAFIDGDGVADPHFWFDPRNWQLVSTHLANNLAKLDPENADLFLENAKNYNEQLELLFNWAYQAMQNVPEQQRFLVTSHDAFQYFGSSLGWKMKSIQGLSTKDEAGVGDIQSTVSFILEHKIPVMFIESTIPIDTVEAVQAGVRAAGGKIESGVHGLYSDAMGDLDSFGGTYIGMFVSNVYIILQSYKQAGMAIEIPEWDSNILLSPPDDLIHSE